MKELARPWFALYFGAFFICAVTCADFDELTTMPLNLVSDYVVGGVLIAGAVASGRDWKNGRSYQIAAWASMATLLFNSAFRNFRDWISHAPEATGVTGLVSLSQGTYLAAVIVLFLVSCAGLASSLIVTSWTSEVSAG